MYLLWNNIGLNLLRIQILCLDAIKCCKMVYFKRYGDVCVEDAQMLTILTVLYKVHKGSNICLSISRKDL